MKLIAMCTIVTGKPGALVYVKPGDEFDVADEQEAAAMVAAGNAKAPEAKAPEAKASDADTKKGTKK